jgi:cation transport ATPase
MEVISGEPIPVDKTVDDSVISERLTEQIIL